MARRKGGSKNARQQTPYQSENARHQARLEIRRQLLANLKRQILLRKKQNAALAKRQEILREKPPQQQKQKGPKAHRTRQSRNDNIPYDVIEDFSGASRAVRSTRSQTANPATHKPVNGKKWLTKSELTALNNRRAKTRSKHRHEPCTTKPDSERAGKIRQDPKKQGKGGTTGFRKWC